MTAQEVIDKYYPPGTPRRVIYLSHCKAVAGLAMEIAERKNLPLKADDVWSAAMLHDIGIFLTDAPSIGCTGTEPYIRHGILGAELLRREGMPESWARVAERHTGAGITIEDIDTQSLPLPRRDYVPETLLERLVCYADKFYSKSGDMKRKSIDRVIASMERISQATLDRFMQLHDEFR
ncbi:MAG: HDIG domain-containing protein [Muribaculaceae bacterium]|nr:HDIG domain-containing protein [Muribaculaceae bacterium]